MSHRITSPEDSLICSLCSEIACMVNWGTSVWEGISAKIIVALFILHNSGQWVFHRRVLHFLPRLPISYGNSDPFPSYTCESKESLCSKGKERSRWFIQIFLHLDVFWLSQSWFRGNGVKYQGQGSPERQLCYKSFPYVSGDGLTGNALHSLI